MSQKQNQPNQNPPNEQPLGSPISKVHRATTMSPDFQEQFARARAHQAKQEAQRNNDFHLRLEVANATPASVVHPKQDPNSGATNVYTLKEFENLQKEAFGDDYKADLEEQEQRYGKQGAVAKPGHITSEPLDSFAQRLKHNRGALNIEEESNKSELLKE